MNKYCVNCKHFIPKEGDTHHLYARCSGGTFPPPISLVTGLPKYGSELKYAEVRRMPSETCGPDGNQYEEKDKPKYQPKYQTPYNSAFVQGDD